MKNPQEHGYKPTLGGFFAPVGHSREAVTLILSRPGKNSAGALLRRRSVGSLGITTYSPWQGEPTVGVIEGKKHHSKFTRPAQPLPRGGGDLNRSRAGPTFGREVGQY